MIPWKIILSLSWFDAFALKLGSNTCNITAVVVLLAVATAEKMGKVVVSTIVIICWWGFVVVVAAAADAKLPPQLKRRRSSVSCCCLLLMSLRDDEDETIIFIAIDISTCLAHWCLRHQTSNSLLATAPSRFTLIVSLFGVKSTEELVDWGVYVNRNT